MPFATDGKRALPANRKSQSCNSGGPIVNDQGQVLAIAVSKLDAEYALKTFGSLPESVNFGIKGGLVRSFLSANNVTVSEGSLGHNKLGQLLSQTTVKLNCAAKLRLKVSTKDPKTESSEANYGVILNADFAQVPQKASKDEVTRLLGATRYKYVNNRFPEITAWVYCSNEVPKVYFHTLFFKGTALAGTLSEKSVDKTSCLNHLSRPVSWAQAAYLRFVY